MFAIFGIFVLGLIACIWAPKLAGAGIIGMSIGWGVMIFDFDTGIQIIQISRYIVFASVAYCVYRICKGI